jgi:putative chitinase
MNLQTIQTIIGVSPDGNFGPMTARAIRDYMKLSNEHAAHFIGQCGHETGNWKIFTENLNYSSEGLLKTFPRYFKTKEDADRYARNPQMIANRVYANRMGNGPEESGDGWKYRGRGSLQVTGKNNYEAFGNAIKDMRVLQEPDLLLSRYILDSAKWYFDRNNVWRYCNKTDDANIMAVSRFVNIGNPDSKLIPHGMPDRTEKTKTVYLWFTQNT